MATGKDQVVELPIPFKKFVEISGYSPAYVYKLVNERAIPCYKPRKGKLFFLPSEVRAFLTKNRQASSTELSEQADDILNGATQ